MVKTVAILGDSLTKHGFDVDQRGWLALLADTFAGQIDFLNRGLSGYTAPMYLAVLPHILSTLPARPVDLYLLFLGTNDAAPRGAKQHVALADFATAYTALLAQLPTHAVLVVTPARAAAPRDAAPYAAWLRAHAAGAPVLDLHAVVPPTGRDAFAPDGVHFAAGMHRALFERVATHLRATLPLVPLALGYKEVLGIHDGEEGKEEGREEV